MLDFQEFDATGLAELLKNGDVTAPELQDAAISRIDALNPSLNAIVSRMPGDSSNVCESSPFLGVPFLVKDIHAAYVGHPMTHGARFLREFKPDYDATIAKRFIRAGVNSIGKTNTSEFGLLPVTEPEAYGATRNPWDLRKTAGGSSGGSAAAVAAGIVPMAHGSDGGGSLRIPASCCGVFGFKPSRSVSPTGPRASELFFGFGEQHVITRTVRDSVAMLDALTGPDELSFYPRSSPRKNNPSTLRIALSVSPYLPSIVHQDCVNAARSAARLCESLGHNVELSQVEIDHEKFGASFLIMASAGVLNAITFWQKELRKRISRPDIEPITDLHFALAQSLTPEEHLQARETILGIQRDVATFFGDYDVILTPTLGTPTLDLGAYSIQGMRRVLLDVALRWPFRKLFRCKWIRRMLMDWLVQFGYQFTPFAPLANVAGLPSMSVPLSADSDGLPLGVMFTAANGRDYELLHLAQQLEDAQPWEQLAPISHQ